MFILQVVFTHDSNVGWVVVHEVVGGIREFSSRLELALSWCTGRSRMSPQREGDYGLASGVRSLCSSNLAQAALIALDRFRASVRSARCRRNSASMRETTCGR